MPSGRPSRIGRLARIVGVGAVGLVSLLVLAASVVLQGARLGHLIEGALPPNAGKMYIGGVEYNRNSWGRFLGARSDYVAELLPIMRLNESADTDIWGDRLGPGRKILYGAGFSPIGFRLVWGRHAVRPFLSAKAGLDVWDHKFISDQGSYIQFTLHEAAGVLVKLTDQYDLRMDIGDFHQSNGFMTDVNPGLDVASYSAGLVYHLGSGRGRVR